MPVDGYECEYHLTPSGWVEGTYSYEGLAKIWVPPPPGRVLTMLKEMTQASVYSREVVIWHELWRSKDAERVSMLMRHFGYRPEKGYRTA